MKLPLLKSIGTLDLTNNSKLDTLQLPELTSISGSLHVSGPLNSLDLSSLKYTTGDLTIEASGGSYSCFSLNARQKRKTFIRGTYRCSSGSTLTTGAKVGIGIGVPATVVIVAGAIVFWWRRRCRSTMSAREDKLAAMQDSESVESESPHRAVEADDKRRIELQSIPRILEMDDSAELKELESPVTASELSGGRMHVLAS